jgi:hypothetical protein
MVTREFNLDSGCVILSPCNFDNETHFYFILKEVETSMVGVFQRDANRQSWHSQLADILPVTLHMSHLNQTRLNCLPRFKLSYVA